MYGTDTTEQNPLLEIDTSFAAYLAARTRSYKDHMVGESMDYAFDPDFSVKQKIAALPGWAKIYRNLTGRDIPGRVKRIFQSSDQAGSMKYPELYGAAKVCAERLRMSVPTVYVRNAPDKYELYAVSSEGLDPFIVATSAMAENCSEEELRFLIGCQCGHIQNAHCILLAAAPHFGITASDEREDLNLEVSSKQIGTALAEWVRLADVTADRAGMICLDNPQNYPAVMENIRKKGFYPYYGREKLTMEELMKVYETVHITPARSIVLPKECGAIEKRILAGMEFLSCEALYSWRPDLNKMDVHTVNKQALEVRCEIIIGAAKEGL